MKNRFLIWTENTSFLFFVVCEDFLINGEVRQEAEQRRAADRATSWKKKCENGDENPSVFSV